MSTAMITGARLQLDVLRAQEGQGLVEYALILLFVAVVAVAVIQFMGPEISDKFMSIANSL